MSCSLVESQGTGEMVELPLNIKENFIDDENSLLQKSDEMSEANVGT